MEKHTHQIVLFVVLITNTIARGCFSFVGHLETTHLEIHPEFLQPSFGLATGNNSTYTYIGATPGKGCLNMICPGFQKTSSNTTPGDVIDGNKPNITIRILKDKTSGDWHVYYGSNSSPEKVGYFPSSLLPGMIDKPVELRFGGYVSHQKPTPSPPMGNGYVPSSGTAASINSLSLIDLDGIYHAVNGDLPSFVSREDCYPISDIDDGRFVYGGRGCSD
uniref:Uncharacterized protein n=1 Tax=Avena sativa TaxID=4498 RepID=A0ACD5W747_AVESA